MSGAWVHNMSPFLFEFFDGVGIRWYGLAYLLGFGLSFYFIDLMAKRGTIQLSREQVADFITYGAIGTLAGGRIGYALFYAPELFINFHSSFPFWGLLEVHKGGMASHGGIAGIAIACILFARKHKLIASHLIDITCFSGPLAVFMGRIANFINGELYGRECDPNLSIAVKFPREIYEWGSAEADKLKAIAPAIEALGEVTTHSGEKFSANADTWLSWVNTFSYQSQQNIDFFKEALVKATEKHNLAVIAALAPVLTPRYPSQLIQALLEGLLVFFILAWVWRRPRKPGVITALFGICYTVSRIIGEQFRLPDRDIGYQALGLTRGQWLSIAMLTMILIFLFFVLRRRTERMGGWNKLS